jgi:DNA (cytosine-5)-methyltransferase 1
VLNALDYGVPQKRERIIICGFLDNVDFSFPPPIPQSQQLSLDDILEDDNNVDKSLWVREKIKQSRFERMKIILNRPYITHENVGGSITPHYFSCALRAGASANYILINNERRPSEREMLRLQGFPDTFKIVVPYTSVKKQTGNSVAVPMIKAVAQEMITALKNFERRNIDD